MLHDLYLWNDPDLLDSFITQGVMLGGSQGFPPLLQQLLTFSPAFVRQFNELRNDFIPLNEFLFFNAPKVCECIKRLFKKEPSLFSSKVWTLNKGDFDRVSGMIRSGTKFYVPLTNHVENPLDEFFLANLNRGTGCRFYILQYSYIGIPLSRKLAIISISSEISDEWAVGVPNHQ